MANDKMINIGCGAIYHPDWVNLDVSSADPSVLLMDITLGLPFASSSVLVCYSSHVLEHLERKVATNFLDECFRVLRTGGVIRLVVPDLELIVREYLKNLEAAVDGNSEASMKYDWIMLEMYDQVVRNKSGGDMTDFLVKVPESQRSYIRSRIGAEADRIWDVQHFNEGGISLQRHKGWCGFLKRWRLKLISTLVRVVAGQSALECFRRGIFRNGGEVHQWMYDRYSLKRLLVRVGFVDIKICAANESRITGFEKYSLDITDGAVRKPDSLFIEASKP